MRRISASTALALGGLLTAAAAQSDRAACWRAMVWRQLQREGIQVARCPVRRFGERLMKAIGLQGVVRGKPKKTTISDKATPCPLDRVNRQCVADRPNKLWVSDFTYVPIDTGFVYLALVIDVFARTIVGWKVSSTAPNERMGQASCSMP